MSQWWIHNRENLPLVNKEQKTKIEYDTGKNPLFLSILLGIKENFENRLNQLLKEKIKTPMMNFSQIISEKGKLIWDSYVLLVCFVIENLYKN